MDWFWLISAIIVWCLVFVLVLGWVGRFVNKQLDELLAEIEENDEDEIS